MLFNLLFAYNPILSCFFFSFIIIDLYFLIPAIIAEIFIPIAELIVPVGIPTKETKAEIKTHLVTAEN